MYVFNFIASLSSVLGFALSLIILILNGFIRSGIVTRVKIVKYSTYKKDSEKIVSAIKSYTSPAKNITSFATEFNKLLEKIRNYYFLVKPFESDFKHDTDFSKSLKKIRKFTTDYSGQIGAKYKARKKEAIELCYEVSDIDNKIQGKLEENMCL